MQKSVLVCAILVLALADAQAAFVHGKVYEWFSLNEMDNAIIDVNSVPGQRFVSKGGNYEFELPQGSYNIHAEYFEDSSLKYVGDENILILEDGNYIIDLLMFPAIPDGNDSGVDVPEVDIGNELDVKGSAALYLALGLAAFIAIIIAAFAFFRWRIRKLEEGRRADWGAEKKEIAETPEPEAVRALDRYAKEVLDALQKGGNRLTQKELREKITGIGEAKISLILSELEDAGLIRKIKRGRGNIIILKEGN